MEMSHLEASTQYLGGLYQSMDSRISNDPCFFFYRKLAKSKSFTPRFCVCRSYRRRESAARFSRYGMRSVCLDVGSFWRRNWQDFHKTYTDQYYRTHGVASERGL